MSKKKWLFLGWLIAFGFPLWAGWLVRLHLGNRATIFDALRGVADVIPGIFLLGGLVCLLLLGVIIWVVTRGISQVALNRLIPMSFVLGVSVLLALGFGAGITGIDDALIQAQTIARDQEQIRFLVSIFERQSRTVGLVTLFASLLFILASWGGAVFSLVLGQRMRWFFLVGFVVMGSGIFLTMSWVQSMVASHVALLATFLFATLMMMLVVLRTVRKLEGDEAEPNVEERLTSMGGALLTTFSTGIASVATMGFAQGWLHLAAIAQSFSAKSPGMEFIAQTSLISQESLGVTLLQIGLLAVFGFLSLFVCRRAVTSYFRFKFLSILFGMLCCLGVGFVGFPYTERANFFLKSSDLFQTFQSSLVQLPYAYRFESATRGQSWLVVDADGSLSYKTRVAKFRRVLPKNLGKILRARISPKKGVARSMLLLVDRDCPMQQLQPVLRSLVRLGSPFVLRFGVLKQHSSSQTRIPTYPPQVRLMLNALALHQYGTFPFELQSVPVPKDRWLLRLEKGKVVFVQNNLSFGGCSLKNRVPMLPKSTGDDAALPSLVQPLHNPCLKDILVKLRKDLSSEKTLYLQIQGEQWSKMKLQDLVLLFGFVREQWSFVERMTLVDLDK